MRRCRRTGGRPNRAQRGELRPIRRYRLRAVTSHRRRKQRARSEGLTDAELQLVELLGEVLELLRWSQVLGYSNQYLLHEKLAVPADERQRVMRAAAAAVEQDRRFQDWGRRLGEIQSSLQRIQENLAGGARRAPGHGASDGPDDGPDDGANAAEAGHG